MSTPDMHYQSGFEDRFSHAGNDAVPATSMLKGGEKCSQL